MDSYITGKTVKRLREKAELTQNELAEKICVTGKAVSKWETGRGLPDISLIEPLAAALSVSVAELLSGNEAVNANRSANMLKSEIYVSSHLRKCHQNIRRGVGVLLRGGVAPTIGRTARRLPRRHRGKCRGRDIL